MSTRSKTPLNAAASYFQVVVIALRSVLHRYKIAGPVIKGLAKLGIGAGCRFIEWQDVKRKEGNEPSVQTGGQVLELKLAT